MELIFWKVFHNKFLLRKIMYHIKNIEENNNSNIKPSNRMIDFNNLNTLEILAKTRNLQLLMYKLKLKHENVYISKNGITELFQIKVGSGEVELANTMKQVIDLLMSDEIRYKFEICNLTEESIKCENQFIFNILINEPYKLQVYPSTLEQCVIKCHPSILKNLISAQPNGLTSKFKTYSIKNASTNKLYWKEMMEFILDNQEYFSQVVGEDQKYDSSRIDLKQILQLSLRHQMKLYDLDMVTNKNKHYVEFTFSLPSIKQYSFEETVFRLKLFCKFILNLRDNNTGSSTTKNSNATKIFKLLNEIDVYHTCYSRDKEFNKLNELERLIQIEHLKKTRGYGDGDDEENDDQVLGNIQEIDHVSPVIVFFKNIFSLNLNDSQVKEFIHNKSKDLYLHHVPLDHLNNSTKKIYDHERNIVHYQGDCTIIDIISTIESLIEKYSNLPQEKLMVQSESYNAIIGYLYDKLICFKNVKMDQVVRVHQLLVENSIGLKHGLYHIFFYMNIRDSRLTNYLLSNPYTNEIMGRLTSPIYYDCGQVANYSHRDLKYHFGKYIKPEEFTMDYLFSHVNKCECIGGFQFIHSFEEVLEKLIQRLFYDAINDMKIHNTCFITESLNSIFKYLLEIRKHNLFFKHLQFIQDQIDIIDKGVQVSLMSSVYTIVSREYNKHPIPKQLETIPVELYDLKYSFPKIINSFNWKKSTILSICSMEIDNVIKFIEFSNNKYQLKLMFELYNQSLSLSRFDIVKCLLQVYKLPINDINFNTTSRIKTYDCYQESKLLIGNCSTNQSFDINDSTQFDKSRLKLYISILSNHFLLFLNSFFFNSRNRKYFNKFPKSKESKLEVLKELFTSLTNFNCKFDYQTRSVSGFIENGSFDTKITEIINTHQPQQQLGELVQQQSYFEIYKSSETQELIDSIFKEYEIKCFNEIKQSLLPDKNNIFSYSFQLGDIEKCNFILQLFPNTFRITNSMIKNTILYQNFHIIKYYYQNQNNNLIDSDLKCNNTILNLKNDSLIYQYDNLTWLK